MEEKDMKTIAILYIATGPYIAFWNDFFDSFEKYFLNNSEVHYYVFTDADSIDYSDCKRVHVIYQKAEPWPIPTLLKFHRFLEIDELKKYDYLYQSNANIICTREVYEADFLPRAEKGEKLIFTEHPSFVNSKIYNCPYERSQKCGAYVPYNCGKKYVFGAMNGGETAAYLDFIKILDAGIINDLKKGIIATWHDESWVNKGIIARKDIRFLHSGYCYPVGFDIDYPCYITGVPKDVVFNVNDFKGTPVNENKYIYYFRLGKRRIKNFVGFLMDSILRRKVNLCEPNRH